MSGVAVAGGVAISYLRYSSPEQAKGDSVRRQTDLRDDWLRRNGVRLDTSLRLEDRGVSGFTGAHRQNPDRHALASLLELVRAGRVEPGTFLIVESLDRLSREHIRPALTLLLNLIDAGVRVVQLLPAEAVYDEHVEPMTLMMAIMELSRGHSESAMKSERVGGAWREKKLAAARDGTPLTARTPSWLRLVNGRWKVVGPAAKAVRMVFRLATEGHGIGVITKRLNAEGVPTIGTGKRAAGQWARSYVAKLLGNRAVVGECQPHTRRGGKRRPDGDPIPNYFPAIVTEAEWYAARAGMAARRNRPGRLPKGKLNLFTGLIHDALNGGSLQMMNKGKKGGGRLLVSYKALQGVPGAEAVSFPLDLFERAVLSKLKEIDPRDVLPRRKRGGGDKVAILAGKLAEADRQIGKLKARLKVRYSDAVADVLQQHEAERKELGGKLDEARREAAAPLDGAWGECKGLIDAIDADGSGDARVRLRAALRRVVEGIYCVFAAPRGRWRVAAVQVRFAGGAHRDYAILYRPTVRSPFGDRDAVEEVANHKWEEPGGSLDLRQRADAAVVAGMLESCDPARVAEEIARRGIPVGLGPSDA